MRQGGDRVNGGQEDKMSSCKTYDRIAEEAGANRFAINKEDKMSSLKTYDREDCSAGFEPGDEGGPGRGNKVRGQNDHAVKTAQTAKQVESGFFMSSSQYNPGGNKQRVQNERVAHQGSK
jgi:hypothetical protein